MSDYLVELKIKREQHRQALLGRGTLDSNAHPAAHAMAALDSPSRRLKQEIQDIDNEISFLNEVLSIILKYNVGVMNLTLLSNDTISGLDLTRKLALVVGDFAIPFEYSLLVYRDNPGLVAEQIGRYLGLTLYYMINRKENKT